MRISLYIFLMCLFTHQLSGTTWYVSNSGSDSNDGMSPGSAFATIQFAENAASAGDSIVVANGNYAGFYVDAGGTENAPIVFFANGNAVAITSPTTTNDGINVEGAEGATVDWVELNGFIVNDMPRNGIRLVWANHCTVRNCSCDNNLKRGIFTGFTDDILVEYNVCTNSIDEHGIYISNSSDRSVLRYNICHHNNAGGIQINADASQGGDGISTDPEIYGNILYENGLGGGAAINLDGVQGAFIYNNLIYENHASGIALFQQDGGAPSIDAVVVQNTIIQAADGRWCLLIVNGATGAQVYNNILINQHAFRGSIALGPDAVTGFDSDYNIVVNSFSTEEGDVLLTFAEWQDLGYGLHSLLADPIDEIFVDAVNGDYHLLPGSQPVDAGNGSLSQGVVTDLDGNARPNGTAYDIGAYEEQTILSLQEPTHQAQHHTYHWITATVYSDHIVIDGVAAGDEIWIANMAGQTCFNETSEDGGEVYISLENFGSGAFVLAIGRDREVLCVRSFVHLRR